MLVENTLLAVAGAAGGIWFAFATAGLAVRWLPPLRDVRAKLLPISIDVEWTGEFCCSPFSFQERRYCSSALLR